MEQDLGELGEIESMMLRANARQTSVDADAESAAGKDEAVKHRTGRSREQAPKMVRLAMDEARMVHDHWLHDFRNALGNTTIAASAVRFEVREGRYEQIDALMRQIEEGCERCLHLLGTMPQ